MIFESLPLGGLILIKPELLIDERGHFARLYCEQEFRSQGIEFHTVQKSKSFNREASTLRGLHYQQPPAEETKVIRCTRGAVFDVQVDLRRSSPSFGKWYSLELNEDNGYAILIPAGFAHGFITLVDNTELEYEIDQFYQPGLAGTLRWNSPDLGITWPAAPRVISDKDRDASTTLVPISDYREV